MAEGRPRPEAEEKSHMGTMELEQGGSFLALQVLQNSSVGTSARPLRGQASQKEQEGETKCLVQGSPRELGQNSRRVTNPV